jgi:plasmid stability protein
MAELVLTNVNEAVLHRLRDRATVHRRTPEEEATVILSDALQSNGQDAWSKVDAIYHRLAASGQSFSDSTDLVREDRDR